MGDEVALLPVDKYKSFLQGASVIVGVCKQASWKYLEKQIWKIFAISEGKWKEWSWFFACR